MVSTSQGEGGQEKEKELTPSELLEKDLRDNFDPDFLEPGVVYEIPRPQRSDLAMGTVSDIQSGVSQELRAVIKAGKEFYFIIDTSTRVNPNQYYSKQLRSPDYVSGTFLARFRPKGTAEMVDYSTEETFQPVTTRRLNARIQREGSDVSVAMSTEGTVGVADEGSSKWIEMFRQKTPEATDAEGSEDKDKKPAEPSPLKLKGGSTWQLHTSQVVEAMSWGFRRF
jgi:hypothetical protein